jgi:hypothetical protein
LCGDQCNCLKLYCIGYGRSKISLKKVKFTEMREYRTTVFSMTMCSQYNMLTAFVLCRYVFKGNIKTMISIHFLVKNLWLCFAFVRLKKFLHNLRGVNYEPNNNPKSDSKMDTLFLDSCKGWDVLIILKET